MDFIVEDGTGVEDASSYAMVAQIDAYLTVFYPDSKWLELDVSQKKASLMKASSYFDSMLRWESKVLTLTQGLQFPRIPFEDRDGRLIEGIPKTIVNAIGEIANSSMTQSLTKSAPLLSAQSFGRTSEIYASPYSEDSDGVLEQVKRHFIKWGYGSSSTTVNTIFRA